MEKNHGWDEMGKKEKKIYLRSFHDLYKIKDLVKKEINESTSSINNPENETNG